MERDSGGLVFENSGSSLELWVTKDPRAAANFAARMPRRELPALLAGIGTTWIPRDAEGAIDWAAGLPADSPAHPEALKQFAYLWAKRNVPAALRRLEALPTGAGKTGAAEGLAFSLFDRQPEVALTWTRAIPDAKHRLDVLRRSWTRWLGNDSEAAQRWLRNATALTPEERNSLGGH